MRCFPIESVMGPISASFHEVASAHEVVLEIGRRMGLVVRSASTALVRFRFSALDEPARLPTLRRRVSQAR